MKIMTMIDEQDIRFMKCAIELAKKAREMGEVPVGAVVVRNGEIIAEGYNLRENGGGPAAHAELLAIQEASRKINGWRLSNCTLYVTLEPCPMCAGAVINSRIGRTVFGAKDPRCGAFGSVMQMNSYPLGHKTEIVSGVCDRECAQLLTDFFETKRKINKPKGN